MGAEPKPCAYCGAQGVLSRAMEAWWPTPWHVAFDHSKTCPLRGWEGYTYRTKQGAVSEWNARAGEDEHGR